jgi:8-amino-7-oxononanoate synthase
MSFHRNSPPLLPIEVSMHQTLTTREKKSARRRLSVRPASSIDFSSNDYLSLSKSLLFRTRFLQALNESHPETPLGSGGSRLLDGNCEYAEQLETFIATFHEAPSGLLFNSGFDANVGVFACIPQPGDIVVYDELIHASVHEGMRLSRAGERRAFKHNCPVSLRLTLQEIVAKDPQVHNGTRNVLVAVESLYSMDGDTAPLREIVQEVKALLPNGNGYVIVDEAHATGIYGHRGAGLVQEKGLQSDVLVRVHTFGKALASQGGR